MPAGNADLNETDFALDEKRGFARNACAAQQRSERTNTFGQTQKAP
jgi:hypothetical protein